MRGYHALDDDWASSFRDSGRHWLRWLHTGDGPLLWGGEEAVDVLRFALAAYASSASGSRIGVDPGPGILRILGLRAVPPGHGRPYGALHNVQAGRGEACWGKEHAWRCFLLA